MVFDCKKCPLCGLLKKAERLPAESSTEKIKYGYQEKNWFLKFNGIKH